MKNSKLNYLFLGIIIAFALLARVYNLSSNPSGLFCDEAERGVSAYYLLNSGRDWHGNIFPVFFKALGEYTPPLQIYSAIPFISIFGLNEFGVRIPSVFWGIIAIASIYLLGAFLFSEKTGRWAAFFLAIQPWSLHYSRYGAEPMLYCAFFILALTFTFMALKTEKLWLLSFLFWALTFYTYNPAKLISTLFIAAIIILNLKKFREKFFIFGLVLFLVISLPFFMHMLNGEGMLRFQQVSYLSMDMPKIKMAEIFFNRYSFQFSPDYLFFRGDPTFITRHLVNGLTPLLLTQSIFILLGIISLFLTNKLNILLLLWVLIYPLGGALTESGPLSTRSIIGAPLFAIFSALGVISINNFLVERIKNRLFIFATSIIIFIVVLINFISFYFYYQTKYPLLSANYWGWQYGPKEIINYFQKVENNYDQLIMSGDFNAPQIFLYFYSPKSCLKCKIGDLKDYDINKKQLFALAPKDLSNKYQYRILKTIYYPDKQIAFDIFEIKK